MSTTDRHRPPVGYLWNLLFNHGVPDGPSTADNTAYAGPQTIRPTERTVRVLSELAKRTPFSVNALMAAMLDAMVLYTRNPSAFDMELSRYRFHAIFARHDLSRIFIHKLTSTLSGQPFPQAAVADERMLLDHLTPKVLAAIAAFFGVSAAWLRGDEIEPVSVLPLIHPEWGERTLADLQSTPSKEMPLESAQLRLAVAESTDPSLHGQFPQQGQHLILVIIERATTYMGKRLVLNHVQGAVHLDAEGPMGALQRLVDACTRDGVSVDGVVLPNDAFRQALTGKLPSDYLSYSIGGWRPAQYLAA